MDYHANKPLRCSINHRTNDYQEHGLSAQYALVYISRGNITYSDKDIDKINLSPGDAFQRFPDKPHSIEYEAETITHSIAVPTHIYKLMKELEVRTLHFPILKPGLSNSLIKRHAHLTEELLRTAPYQKIKMATKLQNWIIDLHLLSQENQWKSTGEKWLKQAYVLLSNPSNYTHDLKEISQELNIGYSSFRKKFKEETSFSPGDFRIHSRLSRGKELLQKGLSVSEIANQLQYIDIYAFSSQFKKHLGVSPKTWLAQTNELQ